MTTYAYSLDDQILTINLKPEKNEATVHLKDQVIFTFTSYKSLAEGERIELDDGTPLFMKLINLSEGFSVIHDNKHSKESAGHPIQLLKRLVLPGRLTAFFIAVRLFYVIIDILTKGGVQEAIENRSLAYYTYFILLFLAGIKSTNDLKLGKLRGAIVLVSLLLIDLTFNISMIIYYQTGISITHLILLTAETGLIFWYLAHYKILRYVYRSTHLGIT